MNKTTQELNADGTVKTLMVGSIVKFMDGGDMVGIGRCADFHHGQVLVTFGGENHNGEYRWFFDDEIEVIGQSDVSPWETN